jgi:hypothetical protein
VLIDFTQIDFLYAAIYDDIDSPAKIEWNTQSPGETVAVPSGNNPNTTSLCAKFPAQELIVPSPPPTIMSLHLSQFPVQRYPRYPARDAPGRRPLQSPRLCAYLLAQEALNFPRASLFVPSVEFVGCCD